MKIKINGKETATTDRISVAEMLKQNGVQAIEMVTVQLNGNYVDRNKLDSTQLAENDEIDFLYFMGGGAS